MPSMTDNDSKLRYPQITSYARMYGRKRQINHGVSDCKVILKALNYYSIGLEDAKVGPKMKEAYKLDDINRELDDVTRMIGRIISFFPEFQGYEVTALENDDSQPNNTNPA
jgi:hypothetical protein